MKTDELRILSCTCRKTKNFIKMNIVENLDKEFTMLDLFEHIGEIRMFSYISTYVSKSNDGYYRHDRISVKKIEELYKIKPSTQHKYLKLMLRKEILVKQQNGVYTISDKFVTKWEKQ